jgi:hypothetical protein
MLVSGPCPPHLGPNFRRPAPACQTEIVCPVGASEREVAGTLTMTGVGFRFRLM